jgi:hypothetical protein
MQRRDFLKGSVSVLAASAVIPAWPEETFRASDFDSGPVESLLWIHGSPYLGHSDFKSNFRGLTPEEARQEIIHFRTAEPWRRKILFGI